jgi:hypothetical protein
VPAGADVAHHELKEVPPFVRPLAGGTAVASLQREVCELKPSADSSEEPRCSTAETLAKGSSIGSRLSSAENIDRSPQICNDTRELHQGPTLA